MKKNNRKGFTIVELVIVIAVIAILAGVLIPTFSGIVKNAKESKALQEAQNAYKEAYALAIADGKIETVAENGTVTEEEETQTVGNYTFKFTGTLEDVACEVTAQPDNGYTVTVTGGVVTVAEAEETPAGDDAEVGAEGN